MSRVNNSDDVVREDNADEKRSRTPDFVGSDGRRRITTKRESRGVRDAQTSVTEQHVPRISVKTTLSDHPVAVITNEALDGYRKKTMRIASFENNTLNWVSSSSPGVLDMTHSASSA